MVVKIKRITPVQVLKVYTAQFTDKDIEILNSRIRTFYHDPIEITPEEFIAVANGDSFERANLLLTHNKLKNYTISLRDIIIDYIEDRFCDLIDGIEVKEGESVEELCQYDDIDIEDKEEF